MTGDKKYQELETEHMSCNETIEYLELFILLQDNKPVVVYDETSKTYTTSFRVCIYKLLENNVSSCKVWDVIEAMLQLCEKKPNKLSTKSNFNNMNIERLILSQKQIGEEFTKEHHTTLLSDESLEINIKVMKPVNEGAQDTLVTFQQLLSDMSWKSSQNSTVYPHHLHRRPKDAPCQEAPASSTYGAHQLPY